MTKKYFFIQLSAALLTAMLTACELDYAPENTYVDEKVYRTEKTAQAALAGAYVRLNVFLSGAPQDQNNYSNAADVFLLAEVGTDNLKVRDRSTSYVALETAEFSSNEHDGVLRNIWQRGYNAIDYANNIIQGIRAYGEYDEAVKRQHIAEARFIRAYISLQLLALYGDQALLGNDQGDGIVIKTEPYNGYDPDKPSGRSSNADCWTQIENDLEAAIEDLGSDVPTASQRVRANRAVAQALLSRVLLWKATATGNTEELQQAATLARTVLQQTGYSFSTLSTEYTDYLFPSNEYSQSNGYPNPTNHSNELLLFEPSRDYNASYPNGFSYYSKSSYYVPTEAFDAYDEQDVRRTALLVHGSTADNPGDWTTAKYLGGNYDDVLYIRLAEMKLTLAEALTRAGGTVSQEAVSQLNEVRQRAFPEGQKPAPYVTADFANAEALLKALLAERRRELAYEGHYRWDLMRTGNLLGDRRLGAVARNRWNLPVPDYEIRLTEGLIRQNSGYQE
ncbi:MAG: RagB/SusD family nutrient uptake outer membrane protein [Prevotella sp.]|nr:RagB/SusD family nutrient uptake outer membrane protein [Prevotella sp.]